MISKDEYLNYLIQQFMDAEGIDKKRNLNEFANDFKIWLGLQKTATDIYAFFLDELKIPFDTPCCAEIGKGQRDSVVLNTKSTTLITPYLENLREEGNNLILPFRVIPSDGNLKLKSSERQQVISGFDRYMTQNPYTEEHLQGWEKLHLNQTPITIGVYGRLTDKNREQKLKLIRNIKNKLDSNIIVLENETYQDTYVSIISTKQNQIEKSIKKVYKKIR